MASSTKSRKAPAAVVVLAGLAAVAFALPLGRGESKACGSAVAVWLRRGQLPLPPLSAGPREFVLRGDGRADAELPAGLDGWCRILLYRRADQDRLVGAYDVGWRGDPARFRLVGATDKLNGRPLRTDRAPELSRDDLGDSDATWHFRWNVFK